MMSTRTKHTDTATASIAAPSVTGASGGERTQHGNFFGMFFLPSSQLYDDDDVHLSASTSSTYSPIKAAASAASNMIGGILSVIDTALAAMNEEMENSSGSISSDNTKESEVNIDTALLTGSACTCATNMRRGVVMQCCQGAHCKKLSIEVGDMKQCSTDKEEICIDTSEQFCGSGSESNMDKYIGDVGVSQENDAFTLQSSILGSISTLQLLFDGESEDSAHAILLDEQSKPDNDTIEIDKKVGNICDLLLDTDSINSKQEDSEYWIVGEECEMNDGWLVVSND